MASKYGVRANSKVAIAASMFERGAKMRAVKEETGLTAYSFLARMEARGHTVKRDDDGVITLVWNKAAG